MTSTTAYFRVRLLQVPSHLEEDLTSIAFEHGALGVSEALAFTQPNLQYDPRITHIRAHDLDVFFEQKPETPFFTSLTELNGNIQWQLHEEEQKDWLAEWKKGFKAFQLVGPYWVVPSWESVPEQCEKPLRIDPGMAFGTGTHATTQMMASLIHKLNVQFPTQIPSWTLIDVGTGTAILAMMAKISGFAAVDAVEIDPEARRTARQNIELNNLNGITVFDQPIEEIKKSYQVVVANIIDGVLIQIQKELMRVLADNGHLLVTGILTEHDDSFFKDFIEASSLRVVRRLEKDEWVGYWLQRKV